MAVEVDIPVEINDYHEKIIGGLTLRQLISGLAAVGLGFGSWFISTKILKLSMSNAGYVVMLLTALPLAIGFLRIDGHPFERYIALMLRHYAGQHRLKLIFSIPLTDRSDTHVKQRKKGGRAQPEGELFFLDKKTRARRRKRTAKAIKAAKKDYRRAKRRYKKADQRGFSA